MKGYKTVVLAVLTAALGAFQANAGELQGFSRETMGYITMAVGTLIAVLRALTDSKVFSAK